MIRKMICLLLVAALLVPMGCASASFSYQDKKSGDYYYRLLEDGTAAITAYFGDKKEKITIPDKLGGKKVTVIGSSAFSSTAGKKHPPTQVKLPKYLRVIEQNAFNGSMLTSVEIPDSVEYIGEFAFGFCDNLTTVTIGRGVKEVDGNPFIYSMALTEIRVAADHPVLEVIDGMLYSKADRRLISCPYLRSGRDAVCVIPEGTEIIGRRAFAMNEPLTAVRIPDSVRELQDYAFSTTPDLTELEIPAGVEKFGKSAVSHDIKLSVAEANPFFRMDGDTLYTRDGTKLVWREMDPEKYNTELTVPDGVKEICPGAFEGSMDLVKINLPAGLEIIGDEAFIYCDQLAEIRLPDGMVSIGEKAFSGCAALAELELPYSVRSIGKGAFNVSGLRSVRIPVGVTSIPESLFSMCDSLEEVILPEGITEIGRRAFWESSVIRVNLPEGLEVIGEHAFNDCKQLENVNFPSGLRVIEMMAFSGCSSLTDVVLPEGVTSVGYGAFSECTALRSIWLPSTLTDIGDALIPFRSKDPVEVHVVKKSPADKLYKVNKKTIRLIYQD